MSLIKIKQDIKSKANPKQATQLQRFFKTAPGEYGEGDKFLGLKVPVLRKIGKQYKHLNLKDLESLLHEPIHEYRMISLYILVDKYKKAEEKEKEAIYKLYIKNYKYINNWDLVDVSCPKIVGLHLLDKSRKKLYEFAQSNNLWKKRIAIISTMTFIRYGDFNDALKISKILLHDDHDLIHKAVGWMLREIGNNNIIVEEKFLKQYYKTMPRTMLRYAIEKFPETKRKAYLNSQI